MGGTTSSNIVDQHMSSMISVVNSATQTCAPTVTSNQVIKVQSNCPSAPGTTINISNNSMTSYVEINVKCAQEAAQSASAQQQIEQTAEQMAESISQALSLNPTSTDAANIMKLSMNVASSVKNNTSQVIASAAAATQVIDVTSCGENVNITYNTFAVYADSVAEGMLSTNQVATAVSQLKQASSQIAKSKQESLLGGLILLVVALIGLAVAASLVLKAARGKKGGAVSDDEDDDLAYESALLLDSF